MSRLGKIKSLADSYLSQYKESSPASYAAAQQAAGGLLIIDGFIGIDNPLGGKKRSGIFGSLIGVVFGVALIFGIGFMRDLIGIDNLTATTTAEVISVSQPSSSRSDESRATCTPTAKYTVNGKEYTQASVGSSSTSCSLTPGETIEINYDPDSPGAWSDDVAISKLVLTIFPILVAILAVASLFTFIIRLLSIIFGWKLLKSGRALAKTLPEGTDLSTIINEIKQNFAKHLFGLGIDPALAVATAQVEKPIETAPMQPQPQAQPPQPIQNPPQDNPPTPPQVPPHIK